MKAAAGLLLCMQRLCNAERADLCHVQPNDSAACSVSRLCRAIIMQRLAALREKEAAQRAAAAPPRYLPCKTASQNNLVPVQPHARYALPGLQSVQHHSAICQRMMSLLVFGKMSLQLICATDLQASSTPAQPCGPQERAPACQVILTQPLPQLVPKSTSSQPPQGQLSPQV